MPWGGHAVGWARRGAPPSPVPAPGTPCPFSSLPVASPTRFGLMLLRRFSSPWAPDSVSFSLLPVTTISTTTATGELLQPRVPAGTGAAPGTAAVELHPNGSRNPRPWAEHLSPFY